MIPNFTTGFLVVEVDVIVVVVVVTGVVLGLGAVKKERVLVKTGPGMKFLCFLFPRNLNGYCTKNEVFIKAFFSKCEQIRRKPRKSQLFCRNSA